MRVVALWLTGQFHTNTQFHLVTFWCERDGFLVNWAVPHGHSSIGTLTGVREVALWLTGQFHTDTQFHTNTQFYTDTHWCERSGFVVNWAVPYCIANLNMLVFFVFFKCFLLSGKRQVQ